MNKKILSIGLLTLGLMSISSTIVLASKSPTSTSLGPDMSKIMIGDAQENTVWIENPESPNHYKNVGTIGEAGSGRLGVDEYGEINYNANAQNGLYIKAKDIQFNYSSGDHLTPNNELYITISVANDNMNYGYNNVRVKYSGAQQDIFDVTSDTSSANIEPSTGSNEHPVNYNFTIKLKDSVNGYINWEEFYNNHSTGHAPLVEDIQFTLSGIANNSEGNKIFSYPFYIGDPRTNPLEEKGAGAIQMDYTEDNIDVTVTPQSQYVCYNGFATADFQITNNGDQFVYIDEYEFSQDRDGVGGEITENGGNLTFEYNNVNLSDYWLDGELYPSKDPATWQIFTINPGQTVTLTITAEGESLENYHPNILDAYVNIPYIDLETNSKTIYASMHYLWDENNPDCSL